MIVLDTSRFFMIIYWMTFFLGIHVSNVVVVVYHVTIVAIGLDYEATELSSLKKHV